MDVQKGPITDEQREKMPQLYRKGQSGNPSGMTSAVAKGIQANAARATEMRGKLLEAMESRIATIEVNAAEQAAGDATEEQRISSERIMALLSSDVNRLLTDSENRGYGAPQQSMALKDGRTKRAEEMTDEELEAIALEEGEDEQE